jgi:hypothetical protein
MLEILLERPVTLSVHLHTQTPRVDLTENTAALTFTRTYCNALVQRHATPFCVVVVFLLLIYVLPRVELTEITTAPTLTRTSCNAMRRHFVSLLLCCYFT